MLSWRKKSHQANLISIRSKSYSRQGMSRTYSGYFQVTEKIKEKKSVCILEYLIHIQKHHASTGTQYQYDIAFEVPMLHSFGAIKCIQMEPKVSIHKYIHALDTSTFSCLSLSLFFVLVLVPLSCSLLLRTLIDRVVCCCFHITRLCLNDS